MPFFRPSPKNRNVELNEMARREQEEHPWANRATALRIAKDHFEKERSTLFGKRRGRE